MLMRSALFWDITWRCVVIVYRRFGTTYQSHLQGSRVRESCGNCLPTFWDNVSVPSSRVENPRRLSDSWHLKMGPIRYPETSVNNYHMMLCNIPEERRSQGLGCVRFTNTYTHEANLCFLLASDFDDGDRNSLQFFLRHCSLLPEKTSSRINFIFLPSCRLCLVFQV
jgi:hypothetical protein